MVRRLTDLYRLGDRVEIYFGREPGRPGPEPGWHAGTVVALDHPGVWVETASDARWFVTNRRRIRRVAR